MCHAPTIYAIADTINTAIADVRRKRAGDKNGGMDWRERLEQAIEERGETMRSASLKAGLGHNYIHGVLREGKDATVDRLLAICNALNVSAAYILLGAGATPEAEALLLLMQNSPERRQAILALLRS